jgi:hypothetical protein
LSNSGQRPRKESRERSARRNNSQHAPHFSFSFKTSLDNELISIKAQIFQNFPVSRPHTEQMRIKMGRSMKRAASFCYQVDTCMHGGRQWEVATMLSGLLRCSTPPRCCDLTPWHGVIACFCMKFSVACEKILLLTEYKYLLSKFSMCLLTPSA